MGTQYYCQNERRKTALRTRQDDGGSFIANGIDYLEVDASDQTLLQVHFIHNLPGEADGVPGGSLLTTANVIIEGGVRIQNIDVTAVSAAADVLTVTANAAGDFSPYTLRLVTSATDDAPPPGFDPQLSAVTFSFKINCPSDFDCKPEDDCPPELETEPEIDYLAKDYASFRQLMLDRLSIIMPDWADRTPADIGIALVEVLAYAGDYLSYYQDAAATEAYLDTARRRPSLRRHARLLDYPMHEGCNARTWVCLEVDAAGDGLPLSPIDAAGDRTRFMTQVPEKEGRIISPARWEEVRDRYQTEVFEPLHAVTLFEAHNKISFYTWGDEECCLPRGATRATLKDVSGLQLQVGDVLVFEELIDPGTGQTADADISRRHAVRLTRADAGHDLLCDEAIMEIAWTEDDALPFPLCLSTVFEGALLEDVSVARGNVVLVDHGATIPDEDLPSPQGHRKYRPFLQETGLTHHVPYDHDQALNLPADSAGRQDLQKALPAIELKEGSSIWKPQRDLLNSHRFATEFVAEMEDDGRAALRFGDGIFGQEFSGDEQVTATYRVGNGPAGNVGAEAIAHVVTTTTGITGVRNPLPAQGGTVPEPLEDVRLYAPQAFRVQERAITEADYAEVTERHPAVQKAVATRRWTGSWYTIFITVDRREGRTVDALFERQIRAFIESFRLAGHDLEIDGPRFVPLELIMTVCVAPGYFHNDIKEALLKEFSSHDLPGGRRGFFHPDNFTFGQPVYLSRIVATAMGIPGVAWVDVDNRDGKPNRFKRWGKPQRKEIEDGVMKMDRLEIARLDNDPNAPENGKLTFLMEGGS